MPIGIWLAWHRFQVPSHLPRPWHTFVCMGYMSSYLYLEILRDICSMNTQLRIESPPLWHLLVLLCDHLGVWCLKGSGDNISCTSAKVFPHSSHTSSKAKHRFHLLNRSVQYLLAQQSWLLFSTELFCRVPWKFCSFIGLNGLLTLL